MIKNFLVSIFMLVAIHSFAQEGTSSPYSFYGIGDVKFRGTVENRAMGGLGILPDSIHLNLQNPATLSSLKLTSFSAATTYNRNKLQSATDYERPSRVTFDYLAMAFPAGKLGLSLGIMPYSAVGYKVQSVVESVTTRNSGKGGLNKVFVGAGYQITKKLSAGVDFSYNFGKIETKAIFFQNPIQYGSRETNTSELSGISINTGLSYQTKIKKFDFISSITFSPSTTLNASNTRELAVITFVGDQDLAVGDVQTPSIQDSKLKLPSRLAFGAGIGQVKHWFVGFESTFQSTKDFSNLYPVTANARFEDASKISVGGYYVPDYSSYSNYFKKITYRAGFRYENTGLIVNAQSIKDSAITLGLGMPVGGSLSNINLGLEIGKKGTTSANLVQENYFNVSIGFSFNDRWFVKRTYN
jgi:hypothetical protein